MYGLNGGQPLEETFCCDDIGHSHSRSGKGKIFFLVVKKHSDRQKKYYIKFLTRNGNARHLRSGEIDDTSFNFRRIVCKIYVGRTNWSGNVARTYWPNHHLGIVCKSVLTEILDVSVQLSTFYDTLTTCVTYRIFRLVSYYTAVISCPSLSF